MHKVNSQNHISKSSNSKINSLKYIKCRLMRPINIFIKNNVLKNRLFYQTINKILIKLIIYNKETPNYKQNCLAIL
jgi:hypothetical protein